MPRPCPRTVDAPIRILGLEIEDWAVVGTLTLFVMLVWTPAVGLAIGIPALLVFRALKKGQPPGIVLHRLWGWGLVGLRGFPPAPGRNGSLWSPWS